MDDGVIVESGPRGFFENCVEPAHEAVHGGGAVMDMLATYDWSLVWQNNRANSCTGC